MQIAILSDTHSRYATVEKALELLQDRKINVLLHCGDIEDSETVWLFQGFTAHFVFGNCDTERHEHPPGRPRHRRDAARRLRLRGAGRSQDRLHARRRPAAAARPGE